MSKIDDLYKRAFGTGYYSYNESGWSQMEQLLNEELPLQSHSKWGVTRTVVSLLSLLLVSVSSVFEPQSENKTEQLASRAIETNAKFGLQQQHNLSPRTEQTHLSQLKDKTNATEDANTSVSESNSGKIDSPQPNSELVKLRVVGKDAPPINRLTKAELLAADKNEFSSESIANGSSLTFVDKASESNNLSAGVTKTERHEQLNQIDRFKRDLQPSVVLLSPREMEVNNSITQQLLPLSLKYPKYKIKMKPSARIFAEAAFNVQKLTNYNSLNVPVNEEIGNVALVNSKNSVQEGGINLGLKWRGFVINSGIHYRQHSMEYKMFYSHTKSWREMSVESETQLSRVDSTFINNELGMITKNGKTYFGVVRTNYSYDSVYTTTNDTTYYNRELVSEMDEKLQLDLRYVTLPVQVAYEHQIKRWFVTVGAGINMSFLANASGRVFNPESGQLEFIQARDFLNPVLYSAQASVGLGYSLNSNWSLLAQPHLLTSLNSAFREKTNYATQFQGYGINFRLRYSF